MINGYYYSTPIMSYVNYSLVLGIAMSIAAVLGIVLFFTFFRKKNEGRFHGMKGKVYNFMTLNRFYAEDLLKFIYIVATCVIAVTGIVTIVLGNFLMGIVELVVVNLVLRIGFELVMMFILLCRKTVSIDRKLAHMEASFDDGFGDSCIGDCGSCSDSTCDGMSFSYEAYLEEEEDDDEVLDVNCSGICEGCKEDCSLRNGTIGPDDIPF